MTSSDTWAPQMVLVLVVGVLVTCLSGCGTSTSAGTKPSDSSLADKIRVSGRFGQEPRITIAAPLKIAKSDTWTAVKGSGDRVGAQSASIIQLSLADARTGKKAVSTLDGGQRPLEIKPGEQVFPVLSNALAGKRAGTRLVLAATAEDAYGQQGAPQFGIKAGDPVVMVADILATDPTDVKKGPDGATNPAPARAPRLLGSTSSPSGISVVGLRKPTRLEVFTLRQGTGPVIAGPHRVTTDYLGQVWGAKKPFDDTYSASPTTVSVGTDAVIPAWDKALAGQREGARVLLVAPPSLGYGNSAQPHIPARSTLVFVIDVLGVG